MNILGIDPGLAGGVAIVERYSESLIDALDVPTIDEGVKKRVDAVTLANIIRKHMPYDFAVVEAVTSFPGQGVASMFRFGQSLGVAQGVVGTLLIPIHLPSPVTWKKTMKLNNEGERSRALAIDQWPASASLFSRKKDHNRAEAALLALYGVRYVK